MGIDLSVQMPMLPMNFNHDNPSKFLTKDQQRTLLMPYLLHPKP